MSLDNDLAAALPDPPPPRPDRRARAIEQALLRFDGRDPASEPIVVPTRTPVRTLFSRPQTATFATVLLVALVSAPAWFPYLGRDGQHQRSIPAQRAETPRAGPAPAASIAAPETPAKPAQRLDRPTPGLPVASSDDARTAPAPPATPDSPPEQLAQADFSPAPAPAPVVSAPPAKASGVASRGAPPPAQLAEGSETDDRNIIVTGSRIERSPGRFETPARSGIVESPPNDDAWNACTVLDPRRSLRACRDLIDPSRPGPGGRAASHLADGLTAAWRGDLDQAIRAFDRAIAVTPNSSFAYLNRGLAQEKKGNRDRAIADFDLAVRWDPGSASAYYHRSLAHRARGENGPADADAKRARQLDPRNAAVLRTPKDR